VKASEPVFLWRASFRVGTRQDRWFRGQPALAIGVRRSFREDRYEEADAFVVASRDLGPVRLHAGASIGDMEEKDTPTANRKSFRTELRSVKPLGGFEWTPGQYPKTTLMGDIAYQPTLDGPKFLTAIAVRYQAFDWGSVELGMRYRESEEIGDSTFFVRANVR
jgi:hypothetical protein